jgi:hypothetical protein
VATQKYQAEGTTASGTALALRNTAGLALPEVVPAFDSAAVS